MTTKVQRIADEIRSLPEEELDEFLSWLTDYELEHADAWDRDLKQDSRPEGRLQSVLQRVRADIAAGRTKPIDEVINNT